MRKIKNGTDRRRSDSEPEEPAGSPKAEEVPEREETLRTRGAGERRREFQEDDGGEFVRKR